MSQPDDHTSLELTALREANSLLRDETINLQAELCRQDRAYARLIMDLRDKANDPETSGVRAAIYKEISEKIEAALAGKEDAR